ncbi:MAG: glycosyl hydrolase 115 family protein [Prevotella sp.]|nr:glycosyl hydrolase 115 family protein [Prevotella sp.]
MKTYYRYLLLMLVLATSIQGRSAQQFVFFDGGDFCLNAKFKVLIYLDQNDQKGVARAANDLKVDIERACGAASEVTSDEQATVVVGTIGHSKAIDKLVKEGTIDKKSLQGKREKFIITTKGDQLIIAGSDRRGTIYGIYELSRQMGVSPWYYWADVPVTKHDKIYIKRGTYTDGEPAVRYRGIFLNDEAPCLTSWVKNTFGTNYGDHRFYEKVFELILRLRGNFMWPAMWSWAFYADDPENSKVADEMGIIMGTSHHEPMARNHQEYARKRGEWGAWNYRTNRDNLDRFFREGIERMKGTEDVVTIGMRGDGDEAMSAEADTRLLEDVVKNQRRIIEQVTGRPAKETPQVWALYKEVMDYYDAGMKVPDDVIFLLCDDNWGNVRRVPMSKKEKTHKGGWGLYYHVDYVGAPRNSKWLNVTPTQNMWEQLTLATQYGIDQMWILNVGDLKPMEYPIQLFMDMAWNPNLLNIKDSADENAPAVADIRSHTLDFCRATFGEDQACQAARLLNDISKLNGRCTAEMLNQNTYQLDEWAQVIAEYSELEAASLEQFASLRPEQRDAYRQIILFPVQAMGNLHRLYQAVAMNHSLAAQGNPDCNRWADRAEQAFRRDSLLCSQYNLDIADGKWNGMMTQKHIGYRSWNDDFAPGNVMPKVERIADGMGKNIFSEVDGCVAIEAEHYYAKRDVAGLTWTLMPDMGRTLSALSLQPYTTAIPQQNGPSLSYRFTTTNPVARVYIVLKSTLDFQNTGGHRIRASIDGGEPFVCNFNHNLNERPENIYSIYYPTVASRVVVAEMQLSAQAGDHTLLVEPLDPAIVVEKIVVDCGGFNKRNYLFGKESPRKRE